MSSQSNPPPRVMLDPRCQYLVIDADYEAKRKANEEPLAVASTWVGVAYSNPEQQRAEHARRITAAWNATRHKTIEELEQRAKEASDG